MSVSLTIQNAVNYASPILKNQRLYINNLEPAMTAANTVLQRMLGSPFIWRFNRSTFSINISTGGGTDYIAVIANLGRIETQWLTDSTGKIYELNGAQALPKGGFTRRPTEVAPVYDDNAGNITFRFDAIPDKNYTAYLDYQQKATLLVSPGQTFGPVPDEFGYLFNKGFLAEIGILVNDARFAIWERDFVAGILATQDGLDQQAKAIFYEQMLNVGRTSVRSQGAVQSGVAGRQQ